MHTLGKKGFSLVEILVGLGLLGGISFWGLKTIDVQSVNTKTIEAKNEYEAIFKDIRYILSNSDSCKASFAGWVADPASSVHAPANIYYQDESPTPKLRYAINTDLNTAPKYGNRTFQIVGARMATDTFSNIPAGQVKGSTNLILKFYFVDKVQGAKEIERKIPLRVEIDNTTSRKIVSCSSAGLTAALDSTFLMLVGGTMRGNIIMEDGTSVNFLSDGRLKHNIRSMDSVLSKIDSISPVSYRWKKTNKADFGIIAQDFQQIFPELVTKGEDHLFKVDYVQILPIMTKGLQEIDGESSNLSEKINSLESEQDKIEKLIEGMK